MAGITHNPRNRGKALKHCLRYRPRLETLEARRLWATFQVNTVATDAPDFAPGNGICASDSASGSVCNFRAAVEEANDFLGNDTITFNLSSYTTPVSLQTELATISERLDIIGHTTGGVPDLVIRRAPTAPTNFRVLKYASGVTGSITNAIVSLGIAATGAGIYNSGDLTLTNVNVKDNDATSSGQVDYRVGGGIYNDGTLEIISSFVQDNEVYGNSTYGTKTYGGAGIYNVGNLTVTGSTIKSNVICGTSRPCPGRAPVFFWGAGILDENGDTVITYSTLKDNINNGVDPGEIAYKAEGGAIRALCYFNPCLNMSHSVVSGNQVNISGVAGVDSPGTGLGGGIAVSRLIYVAEYTATLTNVTFFGNSVTSTVTGSCTNDCRAVGGAIWFKAAQLDVQFVTILENTVDNVPNNSNGAGINIGASAVLALKASIVANNTGDDTSSNDENNISGGSISSGGYNLFNDNPAGATGTGDLTDKVVCYYGLADNGGATGYANTFTVEPKFCDGGSTLWAINRGPTNGPPYDDQRGFDRPFGVKTDIGAFECQDSACDGQSLWGGGGDPDGGGSGPALITADDLRGGYPATPSRPARRQPLTPPAPIVPEPRVEDGEKVSPITITPRRLMDGRAFASDHAFTALPDPIWGVF